MLFIETSTGGQFTWYVGKPKPANDISVILIQADGHELVYIRENFENIPFANHMRIVIWRNDIAQFIYDNLIK